MTAAAILTAVATLAVGQHTPVYCHAPAADPTWGDVVGWTFYDPTRIYLRDCAGTVQRHRDDVDTFAHELLHAKHPFWTHRRIRRLEHRFGATVDELIERVEACVRPFGQLPFAASC